MASFTRPSGHHDTNFSRPTARSENHLNPTDHTAWEQERFTPSPLGNESLGFTAPVDSTPHHGVQDIPHSSSFATGKEYQPIAMSTFATTQYERSTRQSSKGLLSRIFTGWWKEIVWFLVSIACIPALVGMLRHFEDQPLPDWPHGITLNTAVAFISTLCRTAFLLPVVEALSQLKWNWYRKPRPLQDFRVFDEASRGPWGSLKLLFTTRGRGMGVLAALILVSSIATSTLTQSVVTYPTRKVPVPGDGMATSIRSTEYFWATANPNSRRDVNVPFTLAIPRALYTKPEDTISYTQPFCGTTECSWPRFTSLAVCLEMKNITDLLDTGGGEVVNQVSDPKGGGTNITLPNGAMLHPTYGYRNMNISSGTSLSWNNTDMMKVPIIDYTIIFWPPLRAYEVLLHFCVNTYDVSVSENMPRVSQTASYVNVGVGETFINRYNMTQNVTYLTSPDDPQTKFIADGMGPAELTQMLADTVTGDYTYFGQYNMSDGVGVIGTALERAIIGVNSNDSQAIDDARYQGVFNLSSNIAMGLTNALTEWAGEPSVNGTAWTQQTFVSIRWEWITLLVAQVLLSFLVLLVAIIHTEMIGIPIIKGNPLPGLFAISAQEKLHVEQEQFDMNNAGMQPKRADHILDNDLKRVGDRWVIGSIAERRRENGRVSTMYVGDHGDWPS